jgi:hypothetical protein
LEQPVLALANTQLTTGNNHINSSHSNMLLAWLILRPVRPRPCKYQ